MLNKVSLFALFLGLLGLLLVRRCPSFIPSFRSVRIVPLLGERRMITFSLHGTNFVCMLQLSTNSASSVILCNDCISDFSVVNCCMCSFALQIYRCNMIPFGGQSPQEQHSQNVTREGHTRHHKTLVMGVEAANFSRWVLCSTEVELGDRLEVPKKAGDSCHTKSGGQGSPCESICVANEILDVQGTSKLNALLAIESDRVHLASSAGSVGAVVVLLTISHRPTDWR